MPRWLEDVLVAAGVLAATAFAAEPAAEPAAALAPPGEDPNAVLNAARLVLPEDSYQDLAGHLGVPAAWPLE
jgi:hypothetical protein